MGKIVKYEAVVFGSLRIKKVFCEKESTFFVWPIETNGNRRKKKSNDSAYFDTWEEAKEYLYKMQRREIDALKRQIHKANSILGQIQKLKNPEGE